MRLASLLMLAALGCSFDPVDLEGKGCPCSPGWVCVEAENLCVPRAPRDAGRDALAEDGEAPPADAGVDGEVPPIDSGTDAGLDAGPLDDTSCDDANADALICDGFEEGSGFTMWAMPRGATYAGDPAYRGSYAMQASTSTSMALAYLYGSFPETASGELFARAYLYVPASASLGHFPVLHLEEGGAPYDYAEVRLQDDEVRAVSKYGGVTTTLTGGAMPRDRWTCVELRVLIGSPGEVELYVDGTSVDAATGVTTALSGPYRVFYAGISNRATGQTGNATLYMDEVVLSTSRVGCD